MPDLGTISLLKDDIRVNIKSFFGYAHVARMNWIRLFEPTHSLYIGAFTYVDKYPYDEGCGVYMFKIDTKTGEFTQVLNLLEENEILEGVDTFV
jgi:hypothetical protein